MTDNPAYDTALRAAGRAQIAVDKLAYARELVAVTERYRGQKNGFVRIMAETERRVALASGFPTLEAWQGQQEAVR